MNDLVLTARLLMPNLSKHTAVVYILRLRSGVYYVGATLDLEQRLIAHAAGSACRTTMLDPATAILWVEILATFADARARETQIKKWSRAKKEALVGGDLGRLRELSRSREAG